MGNSPSNADGADTLFVGNAEAGDRLNTKPRARVVASTTCAVLMLSGIVWCARKAFDSARMNMADVDVYQVNESFAVVPIHFTREIGVDPERLNVFGGAIAMGPPLGATGAILTLTALEVLEHQDANTALVLVCGGARVATSLVLKRV